jgi:hypothetical protein
MGLVESIKRSQSKLKVLHRFTKNPASEEAGYKNLRRLTVLL